MRTTTAGRCACAGLLFVAAAAPAAEQTRGRDRALELAAKTGYAPVVPVPAEDTLGPDTAEPPGWLKVRPLPQVDGAPIVRHETFRSAALGMEVGYNVYLPPGHDAYPARRFPVLYWLHGMNGNEYANVGQAAAVHLAITAGQLEPLILVFANGLGQSFYLDSADGRYPAETLLVRELVPHVDRRFRTQASRSGRHLAGMSMGGFGALRLAFKHPELFASVLCYAGAFRAADIARAPGVLEKMTGGDAARFEAQSPLALVETNAGLIRERLAVRIVCGSQDRQLPSHRELSARLSELRVDHDYEELSALAHDVDGLFARAGIEGLRFALRAGEEQRRDSVGIDLRDPLRVTHMVRPSYPPEARRARIEGRVVLEVAVGEDGAVTGVRGASGPRELVAPMLETVRQWRFEPARSDGKPVATTTEVRLTFRAGE